MAPLAPLVPLPFYLASHGAILAVVVVNRGTSGMALVGIGALSNLSVVALNGGILGLLADIIPVAFVHNVHSVGDILIAAGGFWLPFVRLRAS